MFSSRAQGENVFLWSLTQDKGNLSFFAEQNVREVYKFRDIVGESRTTSGN